MNPTKLAICFRQSDLIAHFTKNRQRIFGIFNG